LDGGATGSPEVRKEMEARFGNFSWNYFVDEVVLRDNFFKKTEAELNNLDASGVWLKHHWAPYWYTCGLCNKELFPDFILKTETLHLDIPQVLKEMKLSKDVVFPDVRVTGSDDDGSEGNKPSDIFMEKYFSRLTKTQVLKLYELYKTDHIMFNYSPQKYLDVAK